MTERRSYDEHLHEIRADVTALARDTRDQIGVATAALLGADLETVDRVYGACAAIQAREVDVERRAFELMARQQPMAADLRVLLAVLRILHEIELTAGLMRNVARATRRLYPRRLPPTVAGIVERMGMQAAEQLGTAGDAFAKDDASLAAALPEMDDQMDDLQKQLFRAVFALGAPDESALQQAVQISFLGRDYERAADHAVTIGRWVGFIVTGRLPGSERADQTS